MTKKEEDTVIATCNEKLEDINMVIERFDDNSFGMRRLTFSHYIRDFEDFEDTIEFINIMHDNCVNTEKKMLDAIERGLYYYS